MRSAFLAAILCLQGAASAEAQGAPTTYFGACDGSAAVALEADHFVSANDDENSLRIYRIGVSNPIPPAVNLNAVLDPEKKKNGNPKEADIEGAARIGNRIYWIASHGRDGDGHKERSRHRFFATDIVARTGVAPFTLKPTDASHDLKKEMIEQLPGLNLKAAAALPPEAEGGFNIEGLAAAPDGELMIGLRNPLPGGKAIVVPFTNPADVVSGRDRPRFGTPERLELGGRGIRSIGAWRALRDRGPGCSTMPAPSRAVHMVRPRAGSRRARRPVRSSALARSAVRHGQGGHLLSDDGTDARKA